MLKLFCLVFILGILVLDLDLVNPTIAPTRNDNSLVRVKRITNGRVADYDAERIQWNSVFAVKFILLDKVVRHCTGTFVAENMILTTAHCCKYFEPQTPITIYGNSTSWKPTISQVHLSPWYHENGKKCANDLGLIQLAKNNHSILLAPLGLNYDVTCGEKVYVYGYGQPNENQPGMSEKLKVFTGNVTKCNVKTEAIIIEGLDGGSSWGDSGGSVFNKKGQIVGVNACSHPTKPFLRAAKISDHKIFLMKTMFENKATE